jgi:integrase
MGMRRIEHILPYKRHYTFYAARHTYASLARNVVGLDKYTVHELLNHSDKEMRITDRYIERDWQRLFEAHEKIVHLVKW